ncbi:tRNA dimethylallyltransferase [Amphibacillus marinus]|uniref:tRNA dimethylallyltransferase n=1 Tax=Amphibacillus marinus TaxID=872970 RepID=A0A1H8NMW1_9BACI|nr:tRNA (adenosine(37)-N6)-dimethylallyltransferase MiaA [Amphibacillus marinus]SEO30960.1 tRNA dimethylallyltransferase [Amphibacillus marinus]
MKQPVIAIVGPTAVGKTSLSIEVAKAFNGEIISGDSMQVYKEMNIATAKVTDEEKAGIPHHLLDIKEPDQAYSVAEFQKHVQKLIIDIKERGNVPIIVGGTGLYIHAALFNYQFSEQKRDPVIQAKIEQEIEQKGIAEVYQRLKRMDPIHAEKIHPNNRRRLVRALEVLETTGQIQSQRQSAEPLASPYNPILLGLDMERSLLYQRINQRIDEMVRLGVVNEAQHFYQLGLKNAQSMKAIGYKEFIPYFEGEYDLETAIELLKRNSRRYAKRQYTWFKNKMQVNWYPITPEERAEVFKKIIKDLAGVLETI